MFFWYPKLTTIEYFSSHIIYSDLISKNPLTDGTAGSRVKRSNSPNLYSVATHTKYVTVFQERVSVRRALLGQKMEEESSQFRQERQERIRLLHERQAKEVDQFDEESTMLGFRYRVFV